MPLKRRLPLSPEAPRTPEISGTGETPCKSATRRPSAAKSTISINPALADFDRALRRAHEDGPGNPPDTDGRALFLARAKAVVARTRCLWD